MVAPMIENATITPNTTDVIAMVIERETIKGYLDFTGRFPYKSTQGNQYIFVVYHVSANAISMKAIKIENPMKSLRYGNILTTDKPTPLHL